MHSIPVVSTMIMLLCLKLTYYLVDIYCRSGRTQ